MFAEAGHSFDTLGVEVGTPKLNLEKMLAHKDATVKSNVNGVAFLFKKNKIDGFQGTGKIDVGGQGLGDRRRRQGRRRSRRRTSSSPPAPMSPAFPASRSRSTRR